MLQWTCECSHLIEIFFDKPGIAGSYRSSIFKGISILFSVMATPFCIPINKVQEFISLHVLSICCFLFLFLENGHFNKCELITHFGFKPLNWFLDFFKKRLDLCIVVNLGFQNEERRSGTSHIANLLILGKFKHKITGIYHLTNSQWSTNSWETEKCKISYFCTSLAYPNFISTLLVCEELKVSNSFY